MAIQYSNAIADVLGRASLSSREMCFVWMAVAQVSNFSHVLNATILPDEKIANYLVANEMVRFDVYDAINHRLVPESHFQWLIDSERQCSWVDGARYSTLSSSRDSRIIPPQFVPHYLVGRARSIALIDCSLSSSTIPFNERVSVCERLRSEWEKNTRLDGYFSWLCDEQEAFCVFLWEWMQSRYANFVLGRTQFFNREQLLAFFDRIDQALMSDLEKVSMIDKARRAWNQRRQRERMKGRKQCNFVLSNSVIEKLNKLSVKHGLSRTEIVELIIDSEAQSETYISERLRRKIQLTSPLS